MKAFGRLQVGKHSYRNRLSASIRVSDELGLQHRSELHLGRELRRS